MDELVLLDPVPAAPQVRAHPRVRSVAADLFDALPALDRVDVVFHLAGVVSGAAEADFDLGMRVNVDGTRALLDWARAMRTPPIVVFASSLAVFGRDPAGPPPPEVVDDDTLPRPQSSYGFQKFIGEQLVADYTRRGYVRGRSVRLMTVAVRPGKPNAAASGFLSGIIREPVHGVPAVCPVPADLPVALSSPRRTAEGICAAAAADDQHWGSTCAMTLPGLTTTPREMAAALDRVVGPGTGDLISWSAGPSDHPDRGQLARPLPDTAGRRTRAAAERGHRCGDRRVPRHRSVRFVVNDAPPRG